MRFFHPGPTQDTRSRPGSSRRRRERFRLHQAKEQSGQTVGGVIAPELLTWDWWGADGRILAAEPCEARSHSLEQSDGALRIVQGCAYDPGNAAYRFHTAINETTKHASAFARWGHTNPFCDLRQIDGETRPNDARAAVYHADVIHSHADYWMQKQTKPALRWKARPEQLLIRHYHGTRWDKLASTGCARDKQWPMLNMLEDDIAGATLVGARLTLCEVRPGRIQWLPIAVPVKRYRALVPKERRPGPFRIAHSPTVAKYKGTADLIAAVDAVRAKGLKVDLIMIEGKQHGKALEMKADADLTFDSFWLGIQGSGLEAASMGQMVVAGDESVRDLYVASEVGSCPYTFANDRAQLTEVIERAITDNLWYAGETTRVARYVKKYHDYASVARRYENIIAKVMNRPEVVTAKRGKHVAA
jgi:hypothetical protein